MLHLNLRTGRWVALLATGLLGIGRLPAAPPALKSQHAKQMPGQMLPLRQQEIQIELAWMKDPELFRSPIHAQASSAGIKAVGFVPSAEAKARALLLASSTSGCQILDSLRVTEMPPDDHVTASAEETYHGVLSALTTALGEKQASGIEVGTRADGCVTLRGQVASLQDKHAVSVRLRLVQGCACVVNLLSVSSLPRAAEGRRTGNVSQEEWERPKKSPLRKVAPRPAVKTEVATRVKAPKKPMAPPVYSKPRVNEEQVTRLKPAKRPPSPPVAPKPQEVEKVATPSPRPVPASRYARRAAPLSLTRSNRQRVPASQTSAQIQQVAHTEVEEKVVSSSEEVHPVSSTQTPMPAKAPKPPVQRSEEVHRVTSTQVLMPAELPKSPVQRNVGLLQMNQDAASPYGVVGTPPVVNPPSRAIASPSPYGAIVETVAPHPAVPASTVTTVSSRSASTASQGKYPTAEPLMHMEDAEVVPLGRTAVMAPKSQQRVATRVTVQDKPVEMWNPAVEAPEVVAEAPRRKERPSLFRTVLGLRSRHEATVPAIPSKPYETTGTVFFPAEEQEERAPLTPSAEALRGKVFQACGNAASDVWVNTKSDGSMNVIVRIADESMTERVMSRVAAIPEVQSPKVHLSLDVAQ
jgi:hypothetical protein